MNKMQRLHMACHIMYRHPRGLTVAQLAQLCETTPRTCRRDLVDLEDSGIPLWDDRGHPPRYGIIEGYYLPPVHLDLEDALALYLAARLLARYADAFDPHIAQALAKLAGVLPEGLAEHVLATVTEMSERPQNHGLTHTLSTLAVGWSARRKVRIRYRSQGSENVHSYKLAPYLIEPSAVSNATYVIGYASWFESVRTFKVERILSAELLEERFEVPEDFSGLDLLRSAWGIAYGDEAEEVVLRFAPSATRRIYETRWHISQTLEPLDDGGCLLRLAVAVPKEMLYWIRGWGPQVEVLAPTWLREQIAEEARQAWEVYDAIDHT